MDFRQSPFFQERSNYTTSLAYYSDENVVNITQIIIKVSGVSYFKKKNSSI